MVGIFMPPYVELGCGVGPMVLNGYGKPCYMLIGMLGWYPICV